MKVPSWVPLLLLPLPTAPQNQRLFCPEVRFRRAECEPRYECKTECFDKKICQIRYEYKCTKYRRQECRTVWQNQCNGRGRRRRRSKDLATESMRGKSQGGKEAGGGRIQGEPKSGGGRRKRSVNRRHPVSPDHQFNRAVNQTGEVVAVVQLGGVDENIGRMWELEVEGGNLKHVMGVGRQKRVKRSPRGPPYWLNPANNLVVDDPPPPEDPADLPLHDPFSLGQLFNFNKRPKSQSCWREVRRCSYRTYKTLCENVPIKTCDPQPVKECKEKCGTVYYCDNCPSVVGPPSPPPAGTFIVGPPAPPLSRTPRKTSKDARRRQIPRGPILNMQTP